MHGNCDEILRLPSVAQDDRLTEVIARAREASKARAIRDVQPRHINKQAEREKHGVMVEVRHPDYGSIRVKARSNFDAQCAAEEALGLEFLALRGCEVWGIE